jgi:chloramphenicol O-acetyltransferase type B
MNVFKSYRDWAFINKEIKSKNITLGDYSYYAGYYYGRPFKDCIMYLDEGDDEMPEGKRDSLYIGKFCSIATGAKFMMAGTQGNNYEWIANYPVDFLDDDFDGYKTVPPKALILKGDTEIGNDVWIGAEALIMPGVKIADGAVIGARSVVTKNIGSFEIWAGNPAKLIKKRFKDEDIKKLLEIKWWNWSIEKIKENLTLIRSSNVHALWEKTR